MYENNAISFRKEIFFCKLGFSFLTFLWFKWNHCKKYQIFSKGGGSCILCSENYF